MPPLFINVDLDSDDNSSRMETYDCFVEQTLIRSVVFALAKTEKIAVTHLDNMDEEELEKTWYSRAELREIKNSTKCTIKKLNLGINVEETSNETARGLGHYTHEGLLRKDFMKKRVQEILIEQDMHDDVDNDRILRRISLKYSRASVQEALDVAQEDASFAEEYLASARSELEAKADESDEIPSSACLSFCTLRRIFQRVSCTFGRQTACTDSILDRASERML